MFCNFQNESDEQELLGNDEYGQYLICVKHTNEGVGLMLAMRNKAYYFEGG